MKSSRAFTLTELLITMTAGSMLMMLAAGLVHQSMHLTAAARGRADEHRTISRLASQFRADIQMADEVFVDSSNSIRISILRGGEVTYVAQPPQCVRAATGPSVPAGEPAQSSHETYRLQPGGLMMFELLEQPDRAALTLYRGESPGKELVLSQTAGDGPERLRPATLRVEAVIGSLEASLERPIQEASP